MAEEDLLDETWESLLENGALDKKLQEIESRQHTVETSMSNCGTGHVILQEDGPRTQYAPPQPQLKILKRPSGAHNSEIAMNGERTSKQPIKTLQQREAEYAEARLRILGSAKSEEDAVEESLAKITLAPEQEFTDSSTSPRFEFVKLNEVVEVTRAPKGPDGSAGFQQRR